jgi:hypothetical protein
MNYYAQGGQAYGLKSLAQELPKYGRYGDDVVAHISSDEARMLQAMGGSGTINPQTGLPEFFFKKAVRAVTKPFQQAASAVTQGVKAIQNIPGIKQVSDVATQAVRPIDQALVGLDKTVGKAIPGGWGTVASIAGSAMGVPTPYLVGLGALQGSGVTRKGGSFNLQGALIGGATAYATAKLGDYMRSAAPGAEGISGLNPSPTVDAAGNLINQATGQVGSGLAGNASGLLPPPPPPSVFSQVMSGNFGDALSQVGTNIGTAASNAGKSIINAPSDAFNAVSNFDYSGAIDKGLSNASQTGAGIKNLLTGPAGVSKAASALSGVNPVTMGGMALYGAASLSDLDAQRNFLKEQQAAGNIAQAEYDAAMAEINRSEAIARDAVARNPFDSNPDRSATIGDTDYRRADADENLYGRFDPSERLYAKGGEVEHFFLGGLSKAVEAALGDSNKGLRAGSPVGFQNLRSESIPASQLDAQGLGALSNAIRAVSDPTRDVSDQFEKMPTSRYNSPPPGIIAPPPGSINAAVLTPFYNPQTDEEFVGSSGGYTATPESGFIRGSNPRLGKTLYQKRRPEDALYERLTGQRKQYAMGGSIDDSSGMDEARGLYQGNMSNGFMNMGSTPAFAEGGQPRFLSGGGDGMSDSIKASINGTQEARLADGEFVIPADVVSHLGNGSSKAGAKRLYSMMDKVRSARTGTKRQGKQINPKQFMPV